MADLIVGISGRLAAGKTTLARFLERNGYTYGRYSRIIDDMLREEGAAPDRASRQSLGERIHSHGRQNELSKRLLERTGDRGPVVIDGLRFPEDHEFWADRKNSFFVHIHVDTSDETRRRRFETREGSSFMEADAAVVERMIPELEGLARYRLENEGTIEELEMRARRLLDL